MFLHAVLTGLQSGNVERDLPPYLEQPKVFDELLLGKLNASASCDSPGEKREKTVQQTSGKVQPDILSELKERRSNVALLNDLQAEVSEMKELMRNPQCSPSQYTNQAGGPQDNASQQMTVSPPSQVPMPGQWTMAGNGQ